VNIFYLSSNPFTAVKMHCDVHVRKMIVETVQMMVSAARRHGAPESLMPMTKATKYKPSTPHKGGYHNHPCTRWVGDSMTNYLWCYDLLTQLLMEFTFRSPDSKSHFAETQVSQLKRLHEFIPQSQATPPAQAMPDEYKHDDPVLAYRRYYKEAKATQSWFSYKVASRPEWLDAQEQTQVNYFWEKKMSLKWDIKITDVDGNEIQLPSQTKISISDVDGNVNHYLLKESSGVAVMIDTEQLREIEGACDA